MACDDVRLFSQTFVIQQVIVREGIGRWRGKGRDWDWEAECARGRMRERVRARARARTMILPQQVIIAVNICIQQRAVKSACMCVCVDSKQTNILNHTDECCKSRKNQFTCIYIHTCIYICIYTYLHSLSFSLRVPLWNVRCPYKKNFHPAVWIQYFFREHNRFASKSAILLCDNKRGVLKRRGRKTRLDFLAPKLLPRAQKRLHLQFSCRYQESMSRASYAHMVVLLSYALKKNAVCITPHTGQPKPWG